MVEVSVEDDILAIISASLRSGVRVTLPTDLVGQT